MKWGFYTFQWITEKKNKIINKLNFSLFPASLTHRLNVRRNNGTLFIFCIIHSSSGIDHTAARRLYHYRGRGSRVAFVTACAHTHKHTRTRIIYLRVIVIVGSVQINWRKKKREKKKITAHAVYLRIMYPYAKQLWPELRENIIRTGRCSRRYRSH